jgi:DNA replicative helicase MCM subunit Mcm2 (Cdc46/Mcm family)
MKSDLISLLNMKGYIQNQTIILQDSLPNSLKNGDEVEIVIIPIKKPKYRFPTFKLDIKQEYLDPEKIYEQD